MTLPTLYKKNKTGAVQQWVIFATVEGKVITEHGQVDGAKQLSEYTCEAKNVGRSNETTKEQQALSEAKSKHAKQIKKGYTVDLSGEVLVELPRKIGKYQDHKNKVVFPCTVSPKLNGVNGEYRRDSEGELTLWSRGGEQYKVIPHHVAEVNKAMDRMGVNRLAGEVYKHGKWLEDITGAVKKHNELTKSLNFWVFELPDSEHDWEGRRGLMDMWRKSSTNVFVKPCTVMAVESHSDIETHLTGVLFIGYEGLIINNFKGIHKYNERTIDVLKYKIPMDAEFKVTGYKLDKRFLPVFTCESKGGTFSVNPDGDLAMRKEIGKVVESWIGKWVTVQFEMYSKKGKPLKPVRAVLRECDDKGEVLE